MYTFPMVIAIDTCIATVYYNYWPVTRRVSAINHALIITLYLWLELEFKFSKNYRKLHWNMIKNALNFFLKGDTTFFIIFFKFYYWKKGKRYNRLVGDNFECWPAKYVTIEVKLVIINIRKCIFKFMLNSTLNYFTYWIMSITLKDKTLIYMFERHRYSIVPKNIFVHEKTLFNVYRNVKHDETINLFSVY